MAPQVMRMEEVKQPSMSNIFQKEALQSEQSMALATAMEGPTANAPSAFQERNHNYEPSRSVREADERRLSGESGCNLIEENERFSQDEEVRSEKPLARRRGTLSRKDTSSEQEYDEYAVLNDCEAKDPLVMPFHVLIERLHCDEPPTANASQESSTTPSSSSEVNSTAAVPSLVVSPPTVADTNEIGAHSAQPPIRSIEMKCVVCAGPMQLPAYTALSRKCHLKCTSCESTENHAKNWMDIILTALYNLEILHQRQYFHCKSEICAFIDHHWSSICPDRARTPTWGNTVMSQISTHPELFVSHQRGSGYWALKRHNHSDIPKLMDSMNREMTTDQEIGMSDKKSDFKGKRRKKNEITLRELGEQDDANQEYFIEEILSKRIIKGEIQYYVKWEGLSERENSWEKARDIECPELIQDFECASKQIPLWAEGGGRVVGYKRKRDEPEKERRRLTKRQARIPASQNCHHCQMLKPTIVQCYGTSRNGCRLQYCERCLEKHYDEEIIMIQKNRGEWLCPRCRGLCSCVFCNPNAQTTKTKVTTQTSTPNQKQYPISRIIARCKPADSNEWEYLVHYKGCSEYENRWIKLNPQTDSQLLRKYKNALKLRIVRKHKEQPPEPAKAGKREKRLSKSLRTSDFDISRVIFEDTNQKIVVPDHQEVAVPAWRLVHDFSAEKKKIARSTNEGRASPNSLLADMENGSGGGSAQHGISFPSPCASPPPVSPDTPVPLSCNNGSHQYARPGSNSSHLLPEERKPQVRLVNNGVEPEKALIDMRTANDEGSSSEDTSDEVFAKRHARYELVIPAPQEKKKKINKKNPNQRSSSSSSSSFTSQTTTPKDSAMVSKKFNTTTTTTNHKLNHHSRGGPSRRNGDNAATHVQIHYDDENRPMPDVMMVESSEFTDMPEGGGSGGGGGAASTPSLQAS